MNFFDTFGVMIDCSRNAVMSVESLKKFMVILKKMGYNQVQLYMEDTYEVESEPLFGHFRGRYSSDELRELDDYAYGLGIELVPCIQTLAHMNAAINQWSYFRNMRDINDILLVGEKRTYELIESMISSLRKCFRTDKIHIGMDEADNLGRGKYLDKNGLRKRYDILLDHLKEVCKITDKYGFKPMMWSDMFFEMAGEFGYSSATNFSDVVKKRVPKDVEQVYWSYDSTDVNVYEAMIEKHREITDNVIFAGGIWTWSGPCPKYQKTIEASKAALSACINKNVSEVFATIWHNGAECPLALSLPGLMLFAEMDYTGKFDLDAIRENFEFITGESADDIINMEIADYPEGGDRGKVKNPSRYLVYNDPLAGLLDKHAEGIEFAEFYKKISEEYANKGKNNKFLEEGFNYYKAIVNVLEVKADFGVKLKKAYDEKNVPELKKLYDLSFEVEKRVENLHNVHRKSWLYYNKACGFEVHDMIYGALKSRLQTLRYQLDIFFTDTSYVIDELGEDRLPFVNIPEGESPAVFVGPRFTRLYSANVVATVFNDAFIG